MKMNTENPQQSPGAAMPHGQFLRVEKFAIQAPRGKAGGNNIQKVAHEAQRSPGYCAHVEHPESPRLLFGVGPLDAATKAEAWAQRQIASVFHKPSQTVISRKYRADQPAALVGVISVPPEWVPGLKWTQFCAQSLVWLKEHYGEDRLCSVIEHRDERCLHMHFWVVPRKSDKFSSIHPGEKAIDDVGRKAARQIREAAYKKAMARLQDEFHKSVASFFGLERETVGVERLTRKDWIHKKFLDEERERDIQRRIDQAVSQAIALHQLEKLAEHDVDKKIEITPDRVRPLGAGSHSFAKSVIALPTANEMTALPSIHQFRPEVSEVKPGGELQLVASLMNQTIKVSVQNFALHTLTTCPPASTWIRPRSRS